MKLIQEEMGSLKPTMDELRKSLDFTHAEVDDFRSKVKKMEKEKTADKAIIQDLRKQCYMAGKNIEILDGRLLGLP